MLQRYKLSMKYTKNTNKTLIILTFLTQNRSDDSKKESEPCDSPSFRYNYFFFDRSALPLATEGTQESVSSVPKMAHTPSQRPVTWGMGLFEPQITQIITEEVIVTEKGVGAEKLQPLPF